MTTLEKILHAIEAAGGEIFVVGGPVRDFILGIEPKDIDFLVRKMTLEQITQVIQKIGKAGEVGQSFGIVKGVVDGQEFDFAIPRTKEVKTGDLHTDFTVQTDPNASVEDDLRRRDFTWNAMAVPLKDFIAGNVKENIIDPNNGLKDLRDGVINAVGDPKARFTEDPLRMIRAIQFVSRMGFNLSFKTFHAISELAPKLKTVSGERIFEELKKAWLKGKGESNSAILVDMLDKTGIGKLLFGQDFSPIVANVPLKGEDKITAMFIAFFLNGGDFKILKPDVVNIKTLELASNIVSNSNSPHTFIGNLKPQLPIVLETFKAIKNDVATKRTQKMIDLPLTAKELAIKGEDLIGLLKIVDKKDNKKIGVAQKAMLDAIWNGKLNNTYKELVNFALQLNA
jgi:hypothetical protein